MSLKDIVIKKSFELMQSPRVARVMGDERVMRAMMEAIRFRGRLQDNIDVGVERIAHRFNLATHKELREMKRELRRMELLLQQSSASIDR